ncbi:MAG: hypothetical protein KAV45_03075 [Calditrichia bacterium]|jgi:hypothetical protein|nr:hypothetical protein [Calditrichia bacterium]
MLEKFISDLQSPKNRYPISKDLHSSQLGHYYFIFDEERVATGKDQKLISQFDENGIPLNKTYIDVSEKDYVYFPISIGQMGLAVYHTYLRTKSIEDQDRFLKFVEWFFHHATIDDELGARWLTEVPLPQYNNPGPWQSAFSQSRAISILLRGYQLTGKVKYANYAELALKSFTKLVNEGGVTSSTDFGPFYEEYTADIPTLVLNGMIFSLFGLMDYIRVFPENILAKRLFNEGVQTLENILLEYDLGYWSRYNLCKAEWYPQIDPATVGYQRLHISQLEVMYHYSGNNTFWDYAETFRKQDNFSNALKMYKIKYKSLKQLNRL